VASSQELLVLYTSDRELFCHRLVTGDKTCVYHWATLSKLEFVQKLQWKDVYHPTFTWICKSAINWLDYWNSFSGIQMDCLWQTICILERQLLISITQGQCSRYSMLSSRNSDESCHLGVWLLHYSAPAHKSFIAQLALCDCEFVQLNHPAYNLDLAPSNYFLIRNLKYCLRGTWFIDDELLKIAVKAWSKSQNRKFYFQGINSWKYALMLHEKCQKMTACVIWYVNFL